MTIYQSRRAQDLAGNELAERSHVAKSSIVDRRAYGLGMQRLQVLANDAPQAMQLRQRAAIARGSPSPTQALQAMVDHSPLSIPLQRHAAAQTTAPDTSVGFPVTTVKSGEPADNAGLPQPVKREVEALSGMNMGHGHVHYNSTKLAQLHAHAYAQRAQIHLASGQERHLLHDAWHVMQQAQGRVRPTVQMKKNVAVNDDPSLETNQSIQRKVHVAGEWHPLTDLRVDREKEFCETQYGEGYWSEQEFTVPGTQVAADPKALRAMYDAITPLYTMKEFLNRMEVLNDTELDAYAEVIGDKIDSAMVELEILDNIPDSRFPVETARLNQIRPQLALLDEALIEFRVALPARSATVRVLEARYAELMSSIVILHKITPSHAARMMRQLSRSRSVAMAKAFIAAPDDGTGVWKVGSHHLPEMHEAIEEEGENQLVPLLVTEEAFDAQFEQWLAEHHNDEFDAYIQARDALGD